MNTEALIRAMAADENRPPPPGRILPVALAGSAAITCALLLAILGVRPDLSTALMQINVLIKNIFPVVLALAAFGAALRLARPDATLGGWALALIVAPALVGLALIAALIVLPAADWGAAMRGQTRLACLLSITVFSLPVLGGTLWALRSGASTRPAVSGAIAGLLSGAVVTSIYALHCPEDSPLFYAVWYVLGIAVVTALGALIGSRALRW